MGTVTAAVGKKVQVANWDEFIYQFQGHEVFRLFEVGHRAGVVRISAPGLCAGVFRGLSGCSMVGHYLPGSSLFDQRLLEY